MKPEIILALDVKNSTQARELVGQLYPTVKIFKVGAQLFTGAGPEIIEFIRARGAEVFLDLKYFDIPHTVAEAVRQAVGLKVKMLTLHILGDEEMLKAAVAAAEDEAKKSRAKKPLLIGVTVLTSKEATSSDVLTLAKMGLECGLDGVVCSGRELPMLRRELGDRFIAVTPGIRASHSAVHDQKRYVTIAEAVAAGSSFLVVGRPILEAAEPLCAAKALVKELQL